MTLYETKHLHNIDRKKPKEFKVVVKELMYKGHVLKELVASTEIDPHFCEKHLSPIARFAPTEEGLKLALSLK